MEPPQQPVPASDDVLDHALRTVSELLAPVFGEELAPAERAALALRARQASETVVYLLFARALAEGQSLSVLAAMAGCTEEQLGAFLAHYSFHEQCIAAGTAAGCPAMAFLA